MNIKMLDSQNIKKISKNLTLRAYKRTSSIFNITSVDLVNNFLFLVFGYIVYSLISNQISNSSFITAHILSWDAYVYMCGVSLFLNGMDPYDYIVLRDCLPDNWNFYFNMPSTVIYLYLPFAKLTNFQWLFIINSINFFLLISLFVKLIRKFNFQRYIIPTVLLYLFFVFNTFDGAITVAIYSGNMGLPLALLALNFLIDYIDEKNNRFLYFIVIAALLKPIYICFTGAILLKEDSFKGFIVKLSCILASVISLYGILFLFDPINFRGFLNNTSHLTNSIDLGFGFISLTKEFMDLFRVHYQNLSILTLIGSTACILHIFLIYFLTKKIVFTNLEKTILISLATMLFFPRIKVYDSLFVIPIISYLPFYFYLTFNSQFSSVKSKISDNVYLIQERIHLIIVILIIYPLFIYNRWEPYHFTFIITFSLYLFIYALRLKNQMLYKE